MGEEFTEKPPVNVNVEENVLLHTVAGKFLIGIFEYNRASDLAKIWRISDETIFMDEMLEKTKGKMPGDNHYFVDHFMEFLKENVDEEKAGIFEIAVKKCIQDGKIRSIEFKCKNNKGKNNWYEAEFFRSSDERIIGQIRSITSQKKTENKLIDDATLDSLTKIYNKAYATRKIEDYLAEGVSGTLFVIDLDNFKLVNDNLGHLFGDEVLVNVAKAIKSLFRSDDIVGRIGGDEFIAFMKGSLEREKIEDRAAKINELILGVYIGEVKFKISASIGVASAPVDGTDFETIFQKADNAMYFRKNKTKNGYSIYDSDDREIALGGRTARKEQADAYTTFDINVASKVDTFTYELTEFAFQLMEETSDIDSAVNILMMKILYNYSLARIAIYTVSSEDYTTDCLYHVESGYEKPKKKIVQYDAESFDRLAHGYVNGYHVEIFTNKVQRKKYESVQIPLINNGKFIGYVEFIGKLFSPQKNEKNINAYKAFARIISAYVLNMRAYNEATKMVYKLSETDAVTGMLKYDRFKQLVNQNREKLMKKGKLVLVYSDVNRFKVMNETYGYAVGDSLLRMVGENISASKDELYTARVYSDNMISAFSFPKEYTDKDISAYLSQLINGLEDKLHTRFFDNKLSVILGVYVMRTLDEDIEAAISNANFARKELKRKLKTGLLIYDQKMLNLARQEIKLAGELPRALETGEIQVFYQPKIECGSGMVVGAEALVRWRKSNGKFVYPDEFIPLFEKNGSIIEVDYYVYKEVFKYLDECKKRGNIMVPISLNVSGSHLEGEGFVDYIKSLFDTYDVDPSFIEFELTENIYIKNMEAAVGFVADLKELGVKISMDDFGSGYSSLNMLSKFPIDVLKLDKVFLHSDSFSKKDEVIVSSVISMAKKLNIKVLCEGVETVSQAEFLGLAGCDMMQGYLYSKPVCEEEYDEYLVAHSYVVGKEIRFSFDDSLYDDSGEYKAAIVGTNVTFCAGPADNMKGLCFTGGDAAFNVVEIPANVYTGPSYAISMWVKCDDPQMWTSVLYTSFDNGFNSIMPHAWNMRACFRVKSFDPGEESHWCDIMTNDELAKTWCYIVVNYDELNHTTSLYLNGQKVSTRNDVPELKLPGRVLLGGDIFQPSFKGKISDLRFCSAPLDIRTIEKNYKEVAVRMNNV